MIRLSLSRMRGMNGSLPIRSSRPVHICHWRIRLGPRPSARGHNTRPWNSRIFNQNVPNILLSPADLQTIEAFDYSTAEDGGQVISWEMQTKDIGEGDYELRWDSVRIFGKGQGILSFSQDAGETWTLVDGIFLGDTRNDLDVSVCPQSRSVNISGSRSRETIRHSPLIVSYRDKR
jgi:hypothetical protein